MKLKKKEILYLEMIECLRERTVIMKKYLLEKAIPVIFGIAFTGLFCYMMIKSLLTTLNVVNYKIDKTLSILCIITILYMLLSIVYCIYRISSIIVDCYFYYKESKKSKFLGDITIWRNE